MDKNDIKDTKPLINSTKGCFGCLGIFFGICLIFSILSTFFNKENIEPALLKDKKINKNQFGEKWAFSVNEGILACEKNGIVTFTANNKIYAVNGLADAAGYENIDEIWLKNKNSYPQKKDLSPIINEGLKLCEK